MSDTVLKYVRLAELDPLEHKWWDSGATSGFSCQYGTAEYYTHYSGSTWMIVPSPSTAGTLTIHGFSTQTADYTGGDTVAALSTGYHSTVLDKAEAELRLCRTTNELNVQKAASLIQQWLATCAAIYNGDANK